MKSIFVAFGALGLCMILAVFASLIRLHGLSIQWSVVGFFLFVVVLVVGASQKRS